MKNNQSQKNILEGWAKKRLGNVCSFANGKAHENCIVKNGKYIVVNSKFVSSNGLTYKTTNELLSPLYQGDVAMVMSDIPKGKAIAKCYLVKEDNKYTLNQRIGSLRSEEIDSSFLCYLLNRNKYFLSFDDGVNQTNLRKDDILNCPIIFPLLPEQKRIVAVLKSWDRVIEKLASKIKVKKNIKKVLAQKILTGKTRLAGFADKWETFEVGELLDYEQPTKYIVKSTEYSEQYKTPVLTANKSFILGYTDEVEGIYGDIPVIIFDDFTMDSKYVGFPFKIKSSAIKILKQKNNKVNLRFVFEKMQLFNIVIGQHKRNYISEYQFLTMDVPPIKEQDAIIKIIVTADEEIKSLEKRLTILKDQKKYLLNNLITGTIRTKA
jgi:type I restriction enzyme S subunit